MTRDDEIILTIARKIGLRLIQDEAEMREMLGPKADPGLIEQIFANVLGELKPRERTALIAYAGHENVLMALLRDRHE